MSTLPEIKPMASMEEAWAERDRLITESDRPGAKHLRLRAEGELVVIYTASSLYPGKDVQIDWVKRTIQVWEETK